MFAKGKPVGSPPPPTPALVAPPQSGGTAKWRQPRVATLAGALRYITNASDSSLRDYLHHIRQTITLCVVGRNQYRERSGYAVAAPPWLRSQCTLDSLYATGIRPTALLTFSLIN